MHIDALAGYVPTPYQAEAHASGAKTVVASGGIRSGKSYFGSAEFVKRVLADIASGKAHPMTHAGPFNRRMRARLNYWLVAPNYSLLREAISYVLGLFPQQMQHKWYENDLELWLATDRGHARIAGKSAEKSETLVSEPVDGMLIEEGPRVPAIAYHSSLRGRLVDRSGWLIVTGSPIGGRANWVHADLISKANNCGGNDPDIQAYTFYTAMNPAVPLEEIKRAKRQLSERFFRRDFLSDWSSYGTICYDEWNPAQHIVSESRLRMQYGIGPNGDLANIATEAIISCDWGYVDPACLGVIVRTNRDELLVVEEVHERGLQVTSPNPHERTLISEAWRLKKKWRTSAFVYDPARPQDASPFYQAGFNPKPANNDHLIGVRKVSNALHVVDGNPGLRVLDLCKATCKEMGELAWKLDRDGNPTEGEFDPKIANDASDMVRYGVAFLKRYDDDGIPKRPVVGSWPGVGHFLGQARY